MGDGEQGQAEVAHLLDQAVQGCRDRMATQLRMHPRLLGVPMLYQSRADPVLAVAKPPEDEP